MEKKISSTAKLLLKNVIRHTDTHNRMVAETDMWQQHEREKQISLESKYSFLNDNRLDMQYEFATSSRRRAHMDEEPGQRGSKTNYWMKKLYKAEEADNDRWGHSGFKQLYPDKFESSDSSSTDSDDRHRRHRKRKKKKQKHRKESRKRRRNESDTDDSPGRKSHKHSRKRHQDSSRSEKRKSSDNESGCDSVYGHYGNSDPSSESEHEPKHKRHSDRHRVKNGTNGNTSKMYLDDNSQNRVAGSRQHRHKTNGVNSTDSQEEEMKNKTKKRKSDKRERRKKKKHKHDKHRRHKDDSDSVSD